MSATNNEDCIRSVFSNGAHAYLTKDVDEEVIVNTIRNLHQNNYSLSPTVMNALMLSDKGSLTGGGGTLNGSQRAIVAYIANGFLNKQIADKLRIVIGTVDYHIKKIYQKTGCRSRAALIFMRCSIS